MCRKEVILSNIAISVQPVAEFLEMPAAGGTCIFTGTVRDQTKGKRVLFLEFEAYEPMAISEMEKIIDRASEKWPLLGIAMHHRVGRLEVGEIPVVIGVAAAHRAAAFDACRFCIDRLKETVPIWKKEYFEDGAIWVAAHP